MNLSIRAGVLFLFLGLSWPINAAVEVGMAGESIVLASEDTQDGSDKKGGDEEPDCE